MRPCGLWGAALVPCRPLIQAGHGLEEVGKNRFCEGIRSPERRVNPSSNMRVRGVQLRQSVECGEDRVEDMLDL